MSTIGHNSEVIASEAVKELVKRIEYTESQINSLNDERKDIYAEAKARGFNVKILKAVIKRRRMDPAEKFQQDELLALYEGVFA